MSDEQVVEPRFQVVREEFDEAGNRTIHEIRLDGTATHLSGDALRDYLGAMEKVDQCTDKARFDTGIAECSRPTGHEGMHISKDEAVWSPGMGVREPEVSEVKPGPDRSPEAQRIFDHLSIARRTLHGTPEENLATREVDHKVFTDRHAYMLEAVTDPILRDLVEAHGPSSPSWDNYPTCEECDPDHDYMYDPQPALWPCEVWMFISDRM